MTLDHIWHATAFAAVAAGAVWLLRGAPAQARFWVWTVVTVKFLVPAAFLVTLFPALGIPTPEFVHGLLWLSRSEAAAPALESVPQIGWGLVTLAWLAGVFFFSLRWLGRSRRLSRRIRMEQAKQVRLTASAKQAASNGRELRLLRGACRRLKVKRPVALLMSNQFSGPGVWGIFRPVLVLPQHMARQLEDAELESVFLHELAHVRRRDNLTAYLSMAVCCLFWFHPLTWFLNRRLLTERERACDDLVLEHLENSRSYANGLLKVVKLRMEKEVAGMAAAAGAPLGNRLQRILSGAPALPLTLSHRAAMIAGGTVLLTLTLLSPATPPCPYAQQLKLQEQQEKAGESSTSEAKSLSDGLFL